MKIAVFESAMIYTPLSEILVDPFKKKKKKNCSLAWSQSAKLYLNF